MTNKKLTGREALAYMATGGWFKLDAKHSRPYQVNESAHLIFVEDDFLRYSTSDASTVIKQGCITPCPDPTVKVDEYKKDKDLLIEAMNSSRTFDYSCKVLIQFVEKHYQRKDVKS